MSATAKTGITLVIILVIVIIGWVWFNNSNKEALVEPIATEQIVTPTPTPKLPNTAGTGMSAIDDPSNEAIQTDIDAVGKQLTELNGDTAGIDYGINIK